MHFAFEYLGKPWVAGARGSGAFDCWGLLFDIYRYHYSIDLPEYQVDPKNMGLVTGAFADGVEAGDWVEISEPVDGCAVALSRNKRIHHVGIWLDVDRGVVLHANEGNGVMAQSINELKRDCWRIIKFYKHRARP